MKKIIPIIFLFFLNGISQAGMITKVKKRRFIFSLEGMEEVKKGSWVVVETDEGEKIYAKVLKKTKRAGLAILRKKANIGKVATGNQVWLKGKASLKEADRSEGQDTSSEAPPSRGGDGFYIEPYLNYEMGSWEQEANYVGFSDENKIRVSSSTSGFQVGGIVGYKMNNWLLGANLSLSKGTHAKRKRETIFGSTTTEELNNLDYTSNKFGAYVGYIIAEKWRPFLSANISVIETLSTSNTKTSYGGTFISGGLGMKVYPDLFLNISGGITLGSKEDDSPYPYSSSSFGIPITVKAPSDTIIMAGLSYYYSFSK